MVDLSLDKAGKKYWDDIWAHRSLPPAVNPHLPGLNNYVNRQFHGLFKKTFSSLQTEGKLLIEIGCGNSAWLAYFVKEYGFQVTGIDYSEIGCRQAEKILANNGATGKIVCADFFSPPADLLGHFDVVVSMGVVEHFRDTEQGIAALAKFARPGGLIVTSIPNLVGWIGWIQKQIQRAVYDIHVPLDPARLATAHKAQNLEIISSDYFLTGNWNIINLESWREGRFYRALIRLRSWASKATFIFSALIPGFKAGRRTASYILCIARKPE